MIDSAAPGMPRSPSSAARGALVGAAVALERRILAVLDHRHVEHARVLERAARQQRRRHRMPIVGDGDAAGGVQFGDVGELLRPSARATRRRSDRRARVRLPRPSAGSAR